MSEVHAVDADEGPPAPVFIALMGSFAFAAALLLFGFLGFLTWKAVGDVVGVGATVMGLLVLGATYLAWRGSRFARFLVGLLAAVGAVAGAIYAFTGPSSAIASSLIIAVLGAGVAALLFVPESAKRYYSRA